MLCIGFTPSEVGKTLPSEIKRFSNVWCRSSGETTEVAGSLPSLQPRKSRAVRRDVVPHLSARLQERLKALLSEINLPEARLLEEATVLADKSDVQEELTRLEVHSVELRRLLETGGEVGKRLDFLLQELNRETNTILSKSSTVGDLGIQMTSLGLAAKANIERMREQALNLE